MRGNLKSAQIRLLGLLLLFLITASGVFAFHAEKSRLAKLALSIETALKAIDFASKNDISIDSEFSANLRQTINFTGRRYSVFTGQYNNRNRFYSPALGRFVSKDPLSFNGGNNLYRYADNNPLKFTDPFGFLSECECESLANDISMLMRNFAKQWAMFSSYKTGMTYKSFGFSTMSTAVGQLNQQELSKYSEHTVELIKKFEKDYQIGISESFLRSAASFGSWLMSWELDENEQNKKIDMIFELNRTQYMIRKLTDSFRNECQGYPISLSDQMQISIESIDE